MNHLFSQKNPFSLMNEVFSAMESALRDETTLNHHFKSKITSDVKDEGTHYVIEAELPGFQKENIKVEYKDHYLVIEATRNEEKEINYEKSNYIHKERKTGSFSTSFMVKDINENEIKAKFENGILQLYLPKLETKQTKQINIE